MSTTLLLFRFSELEVMLTLQGGLLLINLEFSAYGKVFLVRKTDGVDEGTLYAMKVLKKCTVISKKKTAEHTKTERQVRNQHQHSIAININLKN